MNKPVALTRPEIDERLRSLVGWTYTDGAIRRTYQTDGWRASLLVTNAIAYVCEAADHHADILVTWPKVSVALSTHSAGGITTLDFEVAGLIERQVTWKPPAGSALAGPSQPIVKG
jgi:pterin-4a-carbinolamine dehydratase